MRTGVLVFALVSLLGCYSCGQTNAGTKAPIAAASAALIDSQPVASGSGKVDFTTQIKPILEARCQPCHFGGGKVYTKMPFDRPETIKTLGAKLFTRIKDENERQRIRDFLAQE